MKVCSNCKILKTFDNFHSHIRSKDGLHSQCKECHNQKTKEYYARNKNKVRKTQEQYYKLNKDVIIKRASAGTTRRRRTNINIRIIANLRRRINHLIKGTNKSLSSIKSLGCSVEEFKKHLQNKFQPGMTWDNYGEWHIDHIKPLSLFDLTEEEQFLEACNYNNMQPLWARDNISKGNRYNAQSSNFKIRT